VPEPQIRETRDGLEVHLHVQTRASRTQLAGFHNGALKLRLTSPPVDDAANRAVIEFFSQQLAVPKFSVKIVSGLRSRKKVLCIQGVSRPAFLACLNLP
jgi:uncharacterized protein (TIGR00251 family)